MTALHVEAIVGRLVGSRQAIPVAYDPAVDCVDTISFGVRALQEDFGEAARAPLTLELRSRQARAGAARANDP